MGALALVVGALTVGCEKGSYEQAIKSTFSTRPTAIRSGQRQPWPQHYMHLVEKDGVQCMVYDFGNAGGISCNWKK